MFCLLLAIPWMPLSERDWMLVVLLVIFGVLVWLILRDVMELWRTGIWTTPAEPGPERQRTRPSAPSRELAMDWGPRPTTAEVARAAPPAPRIAASSTRPLREVLEWADEPSPGPAAAPPAGDAASGLAVEVRALDDGVVQLGIRAADRTAAADVRIAEPLEKALRFADALRGFPGPSADRRDVQLGSFDPAVKSGGVRLVLFSRDGRSHAYVTVWPDDRDGTAFRQTTSVSFAVEAVALRAFVDGLAAAVLTPGSRVALPVDPEV